MEGSACDDRKLKILSAQDAWTHQIIVLWVVREEMNTRVVPRQAVRDAYLGG